ncbi:hypothetical protein ABZ389_39630, partial [Streptomyces sp. NPDC005877]
MSKPGQGRLSQEALDLYVRISQQEPVGPGEGPALTELIDWRLVAVDPQKPNVPVVLDPNEALRRRREAGLRRLAAEADALAAAAEATDELAIHFNRSKWWSGPGSEFLAEPELVNARIANALNGAASELLTAQPGGPRTAEQVAIATERDGAALERGVKIRCLYRDTVRDDEVTGGFVAGMSSRGAQFRTRIGPFQRCVIIDRREAFIDDYLIPGAPPHAARHVKDRGVIAFICEAFEHTWRVSDVWEGTPRRPGDVSGARTTALQREILLDTENGVPQKITARRLGISLRRLTTEVKHLREDVFQVPTLAAMTARWV